MRPCARGINDTSTSSVYHALWLDMARHHRALDYGGAARGEMRVIDKSSSVGVVWAGICVGVATAICVHALRQPPAPSVHGQTRPQCSREPLDEDPKEDPDVTVVGVE